jgi:hypothetical protein
LVLSLSPPGIGFNQHHPGGLSFKKQIMGKYYKSPYKLPEEDMTAEEHRWLFLNNYQGHGNSITLNNPSESDFAIIERIKNKLPELKVILK